MNDVDVDTDIVHCVCVRDETQTASLLGVVHNLSLSLESWASTPAGRVPRVLAPSRLPLLIFAAAPTSRIPGTRRPRPRAHPVHAAPPRRRPSIMAVALAVSICSGQWRLSHVRVTALPTQCVGNVVQVSECWAAAAAAGSERLVWVLGGDTH